MISDHITMISGKKKAGRSETGNITRLHFHLVPMFPHTVHGQEGFAVAEIAARPARLFHEAVRESPAAYTYLPAAFELWVAEPLNREQR